MRLELLGWDEMPDAFITGPDRESTSHHLSSPPHEDTDPL